VTVDSSEAENIGNFQMAIEFAGPSPEAAARWARPAAALAAWPLSEWQRERPEVA